MISVAIIGTGNVAKHLFDVFGKSDAVNLTQVIGRNLDSLKHFGSSTVDIKNLDQIKETDIYVIAVTDNSITTVAQVLKNKKGIVAHTSGSVSLNALSKNKNTGAFYPLQTFSKHRTVDFAEIPICIEANSPKNLEQLEALGNAISTKVYKISSKKRKHLHLAAVFVNNFSNHIYHIANELCEEHQVPFEILNPLIQETAAKVLDNSPFQMQTGPARRNDTKTLKKQLAALQEGKQKEIYSLLSDSIRKLYKE